jgi:hypothetical protein
MEIIKEGAIERDESGRSQDHQQSKLDDNTRTEVFLDSP